MNSKGDPANPETPIDPNPDWRLMVIFNNAKSIEKSGNEYIVRTTLRDGIAEGGQEVIIHLATDKHEIGQNNTSFSAFKATSISVNGEEIFFNGRDVFFTNKTGAIERQSMGSEHPLYFDMTKRSGTFTTHTDANHPLIFLSSMDNGDDLVALLHEAEHDPIGESGDYRHWLYLKATAEQGYPLPPDAKTIFLTVLTHEMNVNKKVLAKLGTNKLGNVTFPGDSGMLRVKKSLLTHTLTYINAGNGIFKAMLNPQEINDVLAF